ncbi:MAG: hydantoinase/oxoprolinase, partial [Desulfobacterales bacterium]
ASLGAKAVLPEDSDVANAIGAITSDIVVKRHLRIIPNEEGGFLIEGLAGARHYNKFETADAFARDELGRMVRDLARAAGTSARVAEFKTEDKILTSAGGMKIFMGRTIHAKLTGQPDIVIKDSPHRIEAKAN